MILNIILRKLPSHHEELSVMVHECRSAANVSKKRRDNYQPKSFIFESISKKPTKGQSRQLPFRLHCTIRFSIDDNVNILSPNSKTIHTKFTKPALS